MKKLLVLILLLVFQAQAEAIMLSPIPVELRQGKRVTEFVVDATEDGEKEKLFESKIYAWDVKTGEYLETDDLIVYPTVTKIPAKFKIAVKKKEIMNPDIEKTYRIVVSDVTPTDAEGIVIKMAYDVPVFVLPRKEVNSIDVECKNNSVIIHNNSNRTVKVTELDGHGAVIYVAAKDKKELQANEVKINGTIYCRR